MAADNTIENTPAEDFSDLVEQAPSEHNAETVATEVATNAKAEDPAEDTELNAARAEAAEASREVDRLQSQLADAKRRLSRAETRLVKAQKPVSLAELNRIARKNDRERQEQAQAAMAALAAVGSRFRVNPGGPPPAPHPPLFPVKQPAGE